MNIQDNNDENKVISDEVEEINETQDEPIKIRTIIVKQEDEEYEEIKRRKLVIAAKIAAGIGIAAAAGLAALFLNSKKNK